VNSLNGIFMVFSSYCIGIIFSIPSGFLIPLPLSLFFHKIKTLGRDCSSIASFGADVVVKGFLTLMLEVEGDEEKCSLFHFFVVGLVEEVDYYNSGGGGGERYICEEWKYPSLALATPLMAS
jgi:hypothetical protein